MTIILAILISGGDSFGADKNIYKVIAEKIPSGIITVFHVFAEDKDEAGQQVALNGWKVVSIEVIQKSANKDTRQDILYENHQDLNKESSLTYYNLKQNNELDKYSDQICNKVTFVTEVYFDIGKFITDFSHIDNITFCENCKYLIYGHTDSLLVKSNPNFKTNYELSILRAEAVKNYIAKSKKINEDNLVISGFGAFYPKKDNDIDGEAENRRVEIYECR